jgi:L-histidine N-alpha-methyltransferase
LTRRPKELSPKYFYDERGSELFERICGLEEYYQTRTERSILEWLAPRIVAGHAPRTIVELGSGSSSKTRLLLDAMTSGGTAGRYIPIDISSRMLLETAEQIRSEYPTLDVRPAVGDFSREIPVGDLLSPALVIFLGGTIGNFRDPEALEFLARIARGMGPDDLFLLGIDLVKDPRELHAAYNDREGVTALFNLNVLEVINRRLGGHFDIATFAHYAFYNPALEQIEMHLASLVTQSVGIDGLGIDIGFERGETILTEISRKFTPTSVGRLLERGGMRLVEIHSDPADRFALVLARRMTS